MKEYMALFFTHSGAIKFDRRLKAADIPCELMPVPRVLSSNCGIGAKFQWKEDIHPLIDEEVEKIFLKENGYQLIFSQE